MFISSFVSHAVEAGPDARCVANRLVRFSAPPPGQLFSIMHCFSTCLCSNLMVFSPPVTMGRRDGVECFECFLVQALMLTVD